MKLSPKPLSDGWVSRCAMNSLRLSIRSPLLWIVLYVCAPILTYYIPYLPFTTFVAGSIVILGTFLCFANDHLSKYRFRDYISLLFIKPQPLIILSTCVLTSIFVFGDTLGLDFDTPVNALLRFGVAIMSLYVSVIFSSVVILFFYDIPAKFLKYYLLKRRGEEPTESSNLHVIAGSFSVFGLHLAVDTSLDWKSACDLGAKGVDLLRVRDKIILLAPISLLFIFPLLLGFLVGFYYVVYRELFWQTGITERKSAKAAVAAY